MLRKVISTILLVAVTAMPLLLAGCAKDEIKTQRQVTVEEHVVSQETVVE